MALDAGCISQSGAWYQVVDLETGEVAEKKQRAKDFIGADFWNPILESKIFNDYLSEKYIVGNSSIMQES